MLKHLAFVAPLTFAFAQANAFDLNDCILNGMKGVSSDVAAQQIRYACNIKGIEEKNKKNEELKTEYGKAINIAILKDSEYYKIEEAGFHSMQYTNTSTDTTVTYVKLRIGCSDSIKYPYKIKLKPGESIALIYPASSTGNCIHVYEVFGRPSIWSDVSVFSSAKPLKIDPFP